MRATEKRSSVTDWCRTLSREGSAFSSAPATPVSSAMRSPSMSTLVWALSPTSWETSWPMRPTRASTARAESWVASMVVMRRRYSSSSKTRALVSFSMAAAALRIRATAPSPSGAAAGTRTPAATRAATSRGRVTNVMSCREGKPRAASSAASSRPPNSPSWWREAPRA